MSENLGILLDKAVLAQEGVVNSGDFIQLYDDYFPRVYKYMCYRIGDPAIADDLTAIVFERALGKFKEFSSERGSLGAWIFTISRNTVYQYLRTRRIHNCLPLEEADSQPLDHPSPEEAMIHIEKQQELLTALQCLNDRETDLIGLKFAAHMTNRRIAELTGLSESNVGVILYRALHKLRDILITREMDHG